MIKTVFRCSHIAYRRSVSVVYDIRNTKYDIRLTKDETDLITFTEESSISVNRGVLIGIS